MYIRQGYGHQPNSSGSGTQPGVSSSQKLPKWFLNKM